MGILKSIIVLTLTLFFDYSLSAQIATEAEPHGHTHYVEHDTIVSHKLIFPSKTPDRVIANLTVDPTHSFAVNWRTNQQIDSGLAEVTLATDGPEFRLRDVRKVKAVSQRFENQNGREPLVKATYHSVVVSDLQPHNRKGKYQWINRYYHANQQI